MFRKMNLRQHLTTHLLLALSSLFVLVPVVWLLRMAFDNSIDGSERGRPLSFALFPDKPGLNNIFQAWDAPIPDMPFSRLLGNSLLVSGATCFIALFFGVTAAYAFARYKFPGKQGLLFLTLLLVTLPPAGLAAPFFLFLSDLKIRDSLLSLILVYSAIAVPFAIWTVRNAIQNIPLELEEAAMLEGAGRLAVFQKITLPLAVPSIAVAGFIAFTLAWSEFALAWVLISKPDNLTLAMVLYTMRGRNGISWGTLSALGVLVALPIISMFYLMGRYVLSGLSLGAIRAEK